VKKFIIILLSIISITLIASSIGFVAADHLEPGQGIFKDDAEVNLIVSKDTKFKVYLQVVTRNEDGQLVNVIESTATAAYIPHKITDDVFDTLMGKKEIVTIDNIKYEKVQYTFTPTLEQRFMGLYPIYTEIAIEFTYAGDTLTKMQIDKDYSLWKIHHCATFRGHNYDCVPVFQVLVPTITLKSGDVVTQQWTILRELS
jgi:hypothetical protein|tara:strand:+ start:526 stop:1125 length:600 start_codon:yes stop_codon:yes gene_type:complete